jgi:small subunit ribosomal protein S10
MKMNQIKDKAKSNIKSKIRIKLKAYDNKVLDLSVKKIMETAERTGAVVVGPVPLPTKIKKFTVIRGPFIDKRGREQFEIRSHNRMLDIHNPTPSTLDNLSHLVLPAGVGISIKM